MAARALAVFCAHDPIELEGRPGGPLSGTSFAVKDVFEIRGTRCCYGNPTWLASHEPATITSSAVERLLAAGANLRGRVLTDELALSLTGENHHYGSPPNPAAPTRVSGGSSCGSAAAVALELVDFALGTDTGGSVRIPASHCGVLGFRPTHGAISLDGVLPLAKSFDTVGLFARSPALLSRAASVLLPRAPVAARPYRLLLPTPLARFMDAGAWPCFLQAAGRLAESLKLKLELLDELPEPDAWLQSYLTLQNLQVQGQHRRFLEDARPAFGSLIARRFGYVLATREADAPNARRVQRLLTEHVTKALSPGSLLVVPSAPGAAPLRGSSDDSIDEYTGRALSLSAISSLCGLPQLSMPLARADGCPLGVSLVGPPAADLTLLESCREPLAFEKPQPGAGS